VLGLWVALWALMTLPVELFDQRRIPIATYWWAMLLGLVVSWSVAILLVGRWHGLAGRRLFSAWALSFAGSYAAWSMVGIVLTWVFSAFGTLIPMPLAYLGEAALIVWVSTSVARTSVRRAGAAPAPPAAPAPIPSPEPVDSLMEGVSDR